METLFYPLFFGAIATLTGALTIAEAWRWKGDRYLCDDCRYNSPEKCLKLERGRALSCLAYRMLE